MTRNITRKSTFVYGKNIRRKTLDVLYFHYGILKTENHKRWKVSKLLKGDSIIYSLETLDWNLKLLVEKHWYRKVIVSIFLLPIPSIKSLTGWKLTYNEPFWCNHSLKTGRARILIQYRMVHLKDSANSIRIILLIAAILTF